VRADLGLADSCWNRFSNSWRANSFFIDIFLKASRLCEDMRLNPDTFWRSAVEARGEGLSSAPSWFFAVAFVEEVSVEPL